METLDNFLAKDDLFESNVELFEQIEENLKNPQIHNIGILGEYGSGKSSFIKSFIKWRNEKNCKNENVSCCNQDPVTVSLVNLGDASENTNKDLEECIIKQLFFSAKVEEVPLLRGNSFSSYAESTIEKNGKILFSIIWKVLLAVFFLCQYLRGNSFLNYALFFPKYEFFKPYIKSGFRLLNFILFAVFAIWMFADNRDFLKESLGKIFKSVSKVKLANNEIELKTEKNTNVLNERLSEILYFFEKTKYSIVIFEDIDRFENKKIFLHLRELNFILNNCPSIKSPVKFIYAVSDSIFAGADKVKFFDFIIPVIPYCDSSNVGSMLISEKEKNNEKKCFAELDDKLLLTLGAHIKDTRLMLNVLNEYKVYIYKLRNNPILNYNQLFSLIALKNFHYKAFLELENREGFINKIFSLRKDLIEKVEGELLKEKTEVEEKNSNMNAIIDDEINRLGIEFLKLYKKENPQFDELPDGLFRYLLQETPEKIHPLIEGKKVFVGDDEDERIEVQISKDKFDQLLIDEKSYTEKRNFIIDNYSDILSEFGATKKKIADAFNFLYYGAFSELMEKYKKEYEEVAANLKKLIEENEIIYNLIKSGILTENYRECISYFYEGELSVNDQLFVNSVKNNQPLNRELKLKNIDAVLSKLSINSGSYFQVMFNSASMNDDLFLFLCNSYPDNYRQYFESYLKTLCSVKGAEFVKSLLASQNSNTKNAILNAVAKENKTVFLLIFSSLPEEKKFKFVIEFLDNPQLSACFSLRDTTFSTYVRNNIEKIRSKFSKRAGDYFEKCLAGLL